MSDDLPILGIDLGTTYSCMAFVSEDSDRAEVIPNFEGQPTTPSVVYFESPTNIIVGQDAKQNARLSEKLVCSTVKRSMGNNDFRFECWGNQYRADEVSAMILRKLAHAAADKFGVAQDAPLKVVITVPAYFGSQEREATRNAGRLAGLEVVGIIAEPVAAAFAYGLSRVKGEQYVLVYDLGGGTFDVTVVRLDGTSAECVATDGVRLLGGVDWDKKLLDYANECYLAEYGDAAGAPKDDPDVEQRLYLDAEAAKMSLTNREKVSVFVTHAGKNTKAEITRAEFEARTRDLMDQTIERTKAVLDAARDKGITRIDKVLLVGGSSKMPVVKQRLKQDLGIDGELHDPDQSVAKGAALVAHLVKRGEYSFDNGERATESTSSGLPEGERPRLGFITAKSVGVVVVRPPSFTEKFVDYIIKRNTPLPASAHESYATVAAGQRSVNIVVKEQREQESETPDENETLHEAPLELPPGLPQGTPIKVTFTLDNEGCLRVTVLEPSSGRELNVQVQNRGMMSEEEIKEKTAAMAIVRVS